MTTATTLAALLLALRELPAPVPAPALETESGLAASTLIDQILELSQEPHC